MKTNRVEIARNTLAILEAGYYHNNKNEKVDVSEAKQFTIDHTKLFTPDELQELSLRTPEARFTTAFEVENETTLDATRRLIAAGEPDPLCLNFASAKNPGGGFLGGAVAQEECIARASGLYPSLLKAPEYYAYHRNKTLLYSDHMIYSPKVPVFKDEEGNLLDEIVCTSIITSPAANAGAIASNEKDSLDKILPVMQNRIEKLLALCRHYNHETLVLGAWGCGVFRNKPEDIARFFHEALTGKYKGQFKRVVFAVKTKNERIIEPFRKWFA
ncbi:MAG: TIGR02452 family protein [Pseudobacter sp.]|uniref:TIGR02452 family protein n=1 Tax=Pseudobacter sp. TaxID=2045420 RepID=UPI003F7EBD25